MQKARAAREIRKIWEAENYFKKSLAFSPEHTALQFELAQFYYDQRKYFQSYYLYKHILGKEPSSHQAIKKTIEVAFILKKWEDVINYAEQASQYAVKFDKLNYMVGKAHYEEEDYGKAKKHLLQQRIETPTDKETILLLTSIYVSIRKFDEAIEMYHLCLTLMPNDADLIYELAILYSLEDKNIEAIKYFELAAAKGLKQDLAYWENLANCYLITNIPKGIELLNKVLEKKPEDEYCLMQIGRAYFSMQKYDIAYSSFYKIYLNNKNNTKALYMSGLSMIRKGDKDKGIPLCEQAISLNPELAKQKVLISNM